MNKYPIELKDVEFNLDDIKAEIVDEINEAYHQGRIDMIEKFKKVFLSYICRNNCFPNVCRDDMDRCVWWSYVNEVANILSEDEG